MRRFSSALLSAIGLAASACSAFFPGGSTPETGPTTPTGCAATPTQPVAPGGYYVNGNTVCTAEGRAHLFHGVDRPSLEWSTAGQNLSADDFALMASWKANVVRVALNQDFWLEGSKYRDPSYPARVDSVVAWAEAAGMDIILDLHWSDAGTLGSCDPKNGCQQRMADTNSLTFWTQLADRYKGDGRVLFELYNEPHDVGWGTWKLGGNDGGWRVAGMQELYDAIRATGAENLVVIGGLDFAYDLTGVPANRIKGHNIMYATHPYNNGSQKRPLSWDSYWGFLAKTDPVIVTEFGDSAADCPSTYSSQLIDYADQHNVSWTAWAWFPGGCMFPSIIKDWNGTPNQPGEVVKAALEGYNDPAAGGKKGGGTTDAGAGDDAGATAQDAGTSPPDVPIIKIDAGTDAGVAPDDAGADADDAA